MSYYLTLVRMASKSLQTINAGEGVQKGECSCTVCGNVNWYLIVSLICISLIMSDGEHLFLCLLAICMSSLEKCLFRSFPTFWLGCLFSWFWVVWAACIFWKWIPCQKFHLLLFSPILRVVFFTLLIVSFAMKKLLSLTRSHLFTFVFISITVGGGDGNGTPLQRSCLENPMDGGAW